MKAKFEIKVLKNRFSKESSDGKKLKMGKLC